MAKVNVHSHFPAPLELRLYEMHDGEHAGFSQNVTGTPTARRLGDGVVIRPGRNEIEADFWSAWTEQNKGGALSRHLTEEKQAAEES